MTPADIRRAVAFVSLPAADVSADRAVADQVLAAVRWRTRPALYELLAAGGLEGLRPRDTKTAMLRRLHLRLTARVRARERAEV